MLIRMPSDFTIVKRCFPSVHKDHVLYPPKKYYHPQNNTSEHACLHPAHTLVWRFILIAPLVTAWGYKSVFIALTFLCFLNLRGDNTEISFSSITEARKTTALNKAIVFYKNQKPATKHNTSFFFFHTAFTVRKVHGCTGRKYAHLTQKLQKQYL